ncbi:MAG: choice-of-anchor V domain-containing protein, partial [Bryobacteraceae bacterium]
MSIDFRSVACCLVAAAIPIALFARSTGPPIRRTGAPVDDNGATCTACHRTFERPNPDQIGKITIQAQNYRPSARQTLRVTVEHPEATRWGFQLTARRVSDETQMAGTFTPSQTVRVQCASGTDAPCGGSLEFASHLAASTGAGEGATGRRT